MNYRCGHWAERRHHASHPAGSSVSAPKSGPHLGCLQLIDSPLTPALRVGFRSALIGTPLKERILKCYQHIESGTTRDPFRSAMTLQLEARGVQRRFCVIVPEFSGISPFLRGSTLLAKATGPLRFGKMHDFACARPPLSCPKLPMYIIWSQRHQKDDAHSWLRAQAEKIAQSLRAPSGKPIWTLDKTADEAIGPLVAASFFVAVSAFRLIPTITGCRLEHLSSGDFEDPLFGLVQAFRRSGVL